MAEVAYIDPNPEGLDIINHEDLSIFVELVTTKKERSSINVNGENKTYSLNAGGKKTPIRFIKGADIDGDGKEQLTTHYTEINTNFNEANPDLETLGITSIDIDFNSAYTPLVNIKFTDVRGKLFEMGNESPYNVFFNMPYPIFELTVKGYYGQSVKYCLHLTKFTGKLNDKTGSFEISCDFVGYTYAFLADMLMGLLRGIAETDIAKEKIVLAKQKNPNFLSFNELNEKIKKLNKEIQKLKSDNKKVAQLALAEDAIIAIGEIKNKIRKLVNQLTGTVDIDGNKKVEILNFNQLALLREPTSDISRQNLEGLITNYNNTLAEKVSDVNEAVGNDRYSIDANKLILSEEKNTLAKGVRKVDFHTPVYQDVVDPDGEGYINNATKKKKIPNADQSGLEEGQKTYKALNIIKNGQTDEEEKEGNGKNAYYEDIRERIEQIPEGKVSETQTMWLIDLRDAFEHLSKIENDIRNDQKDTKEAVSDELIQQIKEIFGFEPTIRNMVYILTEHVHIFMQCVKEVAEQVAKTIDSNTREVHLEKLVVDRKWDLADKSDRNCDSSEDADARGGELNDILPFPDYKEYNVESEAFEDAWIGTKAPLMPEVDFIEQLLEGLLVAKKKDNELLEELEYGEDEWYPINVFDTKFVNGWNNPWKLFKESIDPDEVIRHMLMRATIFLGYSHTLLSDAEIKVMAKLEANNAFNNIDSEEIRRNISLYQGSSGVQQLWTNTLKLAKANGHEPWRNASKIWNGDRMFTSALFNKQALGWASEFEIIGGYSTGDLAEDALSFFTFGLVDGEEALNETIEMDEFSYIAVPNFDRLEQINTILKQYGGTGIADDLVAYEKGVDYNGGGGKNISLGTLINKTDYKRMKDAAKPSEVFSYADWLNTKFYLPLSTPQEQDRQFFTGNELVVKDTSKTIVTGQLATNADRIALRNAGKVFFSSFIGGNSGDNWVSKKDDGASTIQIINSGKYDKTPQGRYPETEENLFGDINTSAALDMSDYDEIPGEGLSDYHGMFAGKWKTHEFRVLELGEDLTFEGTGSQVPAWVRFYAATTSGRPIFTVQRRVISDSVKQTPYDMVLQSDGITVKGGAKNPSAYDKQVLKELGISLPEGPYNAGFMGDQSKILNARNDNEFGKTNQFLIQYMDEGLANVAIPYLGFEVYAPRSSGFGIPGVPVGDFLFAQYPIFGTDLYAQQSDEGKAYLFLHSIPWDGMVYLFEEAWLGKIGNPFDNNVFNFFDACGVAGEEIDTGSQCTRGGGLFTHHVQHLFNQRSGFIEAPYLWICFLGAILWRYRFGTEANPDPLVWEKNGYNLIPLSKKGTGIPEWTQYCLPNIQRNQAFGFFSARDELSDLIAGDFGAYFFDNLKESGKTYVDVERVITRMPEAMGQIFIDEFLNFVKSSDWEKVRREYDIFYKADGTYATEDERIELWLNWTNGMANDPNTFLSNPNLNPNIRQNYIIASRDDKYATYFLTDAGDNKFGTNHPLYKKMKTNAANNNVAQAKIDAKNNNFGSPFNFFLEMRDGGDRINGAAALDGQKTLFELMTRTKMIINSSRRLWAANAENPDDIGVSHPFRWEPTQMRTYLKSFFTEYKRLVDEEQEEIVSEEEQLKRELFNTIDADDIKLQLYKTVKSIYDKWVPGNECELEFCGSPNPSKDKGFECPQLIDTFRFIDRAYNDIGDKFFVNPIDMVIHMIEDYNISMYDYLARMLVDNNFDFIPLPTFINYNNPDAVKEVFTPYPFNTSPLATGPQFICMYIGERSKHLNLGKESQYKNDGFDISKEECRPADFKQQSGDTATYVPAFRAAYGDQNQSIFKNFKLDQSEFTETEESLQIIDELASQQATSAGQNLFNVYRTRSYSATIDTFGNAQIQPFMYFQLDNVPMFTGAYTIIHVKHSIKPNHMSTQFKGVRVRRPKTPMIKKTTLFMSLIGSLTDVDTEGVTLDGLDESGGYNGGSGGGSGTYTVYRRGAPVPQNSGAPGYAGCISYKMKDNEGLKSQTKNLAETLSSCKSGVITPYGLEEVGKFMEQIGRKWHAYAKNKDITEAIYYNDNSQLGGGYHPCHATHAYGKDIDIRQIGKAKGNKSFTINSSFYSREETIKLIEMMLDEALQTPDFKSSRNQIIDVMFFNDREVINYFKDYKGYGRDMVKYSDGHDNHIHVRFGLPDKIENDEPNGYLICKETLPSPSGTIEIQDTSCPKTSYPELPILQEAPPNRFGYAEAAQYLNANYSPAIARSVFVLLGAEAAKDRPNEQFKSAGGNNFGGVQTDSGRWGKPDRAFQAQFCKKDAVKYRMFATFEKPTDFLDFVADRLEAKGFGKQNSGAHWTERYLNDWVFKNLQSKDPAKYAEKYPNKLAIYNTWSRKFDDYV